MPETGRTRWIERAWYGARAPLLLRPFSPLYALVTRARRAAYQAGWLRAAHAGVPTVVVGNLTIGGTGKTPLVLWLAQQLRDAGRRPGILLRGYGGSLRGPHRVLPGDDAAQVGDEALLYARRHLCPVAIGARRIDAARLLVEQGCDVLLADDGLQHLALARDLEVVLVDGARGFGNGWMLPAGPLREPASRLSQAGLVIVHGEDAHGVVPAGVPSLRMHLEPVSLRRLDDDGEVPLSSLQGSTVHALAGIGHPQRFFATLRALGARTIEHVRPDHYQPVAADLDVGHPLIITGKDAVKCAALAAGRRDVFVLQVAAVLSAADAARLLGRVLALRRV